MAVLKSNSAPQSGSYEERVLNVADKVVGMTTNENKSKEAMTLNIIKCAIELESPEVKFRENRVSKVWPIFLKDVMDKIKRNKKVSLK